MQDSKDYFELYYNFVSDFKLDDLMAGSLGGWGEYRPLDRDGNPGNDTVKMMHSDIAFAERLYNIIAAADELPGVSVVAAWAKGPAGEPPAPPAPPAEPAPAPGDAGKLPESQDELAGRIYELEKGMPNVNIIHYLRSKGTWEFMKMAGNMDRLIGSVVAGLSKSVKYGYLFGIPESRLKEIRDRIAGDLMLAAADDFFGRALPGVLGWERKNPGNPWKLTPGDADRIAGRFLRGRIRNACIKYARGYAYTYGMNTAPDMTLPEDFRWADSHKVLPMLPAILLDIDNAVRFRMMALMFGTTGTVTYSALGMNPVVTEDSLERDYPAINGLCTLLVTEIVRGARAGDYFDPRDTDSSNDAKEAELRDYSLRFLYRKLSGGLLTKDVALLREAVDAQFAASHNVFKPHGRDDAQLRRCMAFLRRMARVAVVRAIYELRKGGREGVEKALAKPLQL